MDEKAKADIYLAFLDRILAGEKVSGPVEDVEIEKLLLMAKTMIEADLSVKSQMREKLRKQLLTQVTKGNTSKISMLFRDNDELDEEALDYVAAGFGGRDEEQRNICLFCGSRLQKLEGKCPCCNH